MFELTSGAINELGLHVVSRSTEPLVIDIPAGTYFLELVGPGIKARTRLTLLGPTANQRSKT